MSQKPLISPVVRWEAREYMVGMTLGTIGDLFHDHGFSADYSYEPPTSGERRSLVEQFYVEINWTDRQQCEDVLGVFEALIDDAEADEARDSYAANRMWSERFTRMLRRDGFTRDNDGRVYPRWASLTAESIASLPAESAIPILMRRMWDNVDDDPDAAIGAAKELIEATAKHLLSTAGEAIGTAESMPSLIARTQKLLDLHPTSIAPTKDGAATIKGILGATSRIALGVNSLRRDYGTGHGRATRASGLNSRHARLAAHASDTWVRFTLDTHAARAEPGAWTS